MDDDLSSYPNFPIFILPTQEGGQDLEEWTTTNEEQ
jgi:hypothetical protein